jgi:hypothetical protein
LSLGSLTCHFSFALQHIVIPPISTPYPPETTMAKKDTFRIVTRGSDGSLMIRDYPTCEPILNLHLQVGTDDCSTDLELRGLPIFRGLIGPIPEGKNIVRYESPEVFETLTKEWGSAKPRRRTRRPKLERSAPDTVTS